MKPWISVFAVISFFIAACSDNSSDSARTAESPEVAEAPAPDSSAAAPSVWLADPCSLISDQKMSKLLPHPVAGSVAARGLCNYGSVDLNLGRVNIEVFVQDVKATGCDLFFSVGGFNSAEPIDGIGTAARWKGGSGIKQLGVCLDNEEAFAVTVYDPDKTTDTLVTARKVGELVVARITDR